MPRAARNGLEIFGATRMSHDKLRQAIAFEAARLMYDRSESEYFTAKRKAAKRICRGSVKPSDLPSNSEIRDLIQVFARVHEGESRSNNLYQMRCQALKMMRLLCRWRPRLIGSVLTGHIRQGSDIDIHVFCDNSSLIELVLDNEGYSYDVERKQVVKHQESRIFTHIHIREKYDIELTLYREDQAHYHFRSSITGKAIERVSIRELEALIEREHGDMEPEPTAAGSSGFRCYDLFEMLLQPLANVKQSARYHPEGDVLYHLLQVFELARKQVPYDEEFLQAALLHDIGKGIDPNDHVNAALQALEGLITERTRYLIENHMMAHQYKSGELGHRNCIRLERSEYLEDLLLLQELDKQGREPGVPVCTVTEALNYLRGLDHDHQYSP